MACVEIDCLDATTIASNSVIFAVGKRGQGKSYLCRYLLYLNRRKIDYCVGMSLTERQNGFLSSFLAPSMVYDEIKPEVFKHLKVLHERVKGNGQTLRGALYLDDCMAAKNAFNRLPLKEHVSQICKNGRHWPIMFINAMQNFKDMPPEFRSQADWIFVFASGNEDEIEAIRSEYLSSTISKDNFRTLVRTLTADRGILVIRNDANNSNDIRKMVYKFKAKATPDRPFHIGAPVFYQLSDYYRPRVATEVGPLKASDIREDIAESSVLSKRGDIVIHVRGETSVKT